MMYLLSRSVAAEFVVACTLGFALLAPIAATAAIEVDLRVLPGVAQQSEGTITVPQYTKPLVDGGALFTETTQLPQSDLYIGYRIAVTAPTDSFPPQGFSVQVYYIGFDGFVELEPEKYSPITFAAQESGGLVGFDRWEAIYVRKPCSGSGEIAAIVYVRVRDTEAVAEAGAAPALLSSIPEAQSKP